MAERKIIKLGKFGWKRRAEQTTSAPIPHRSSDGVGGVDPSQCYLDVIPEARGVCFTTIRNVTNFVNVMLNTNYAI